MVSKFLTDLPKKIVPSTNDIVLIEDINGVATKTVTLSNLRDFIFNYIVPDLSATNFYASTAKFINLDITQYELSGFNSTGSVFVSGNIWSSGKIIAVGDGNSDDWYSVYSYVNANSGKWESNWSLTNTNSGVWENTYISINPLTASWQSTYSTVNSTSAANTLTTSICAMSGNSSIPFTLSFTNGLLTGISWG